MKQVLQEIMLDFQELQLETGTSRRLKLGTVDGARQGQCMHRGSPLRKINVLVTRDHDEDIYLNGRQIHIISAWRFLLGLPEG